MNRECRASSGGSGLLDEAINPGGHLLKARHGISSRAPTLYGAFDPNAMPLEQHRSPLDDAVRHCDGLEVYGLFLARMCFNKSCGTM